MLRRALVATIVVGGARAHADEPSRQDDRVRTVGTTGRYVHGADHEAGTLDVWWREPIADRLWAEGAIGVMLGTWRGATTATLANPVVAIGARGSARSTVRLALTLPAASQRGAPGALAQRLAGDHPNDPSRFAPGASTIAAEFAQTRHGRLGLVRADLGLAWTFRPGQASLPLLHADVSGAVAIASGVELTAGFRSTAYLLADTPGEDFVHVLTLGVTLEAGPATTALALEVPVDGAARTAGLLMATATIGLRP